MPVQPEPGAPAPAGFIPLSAPEIGGNEWQYLRECLDSGWVSSAGAFVNRFEREVACRTGRRFAVATSSGTAALHIALLVAGVEPDDEVLVSTLTFVAPANAIRYVGAWPVFIDAEPDYWQMDPARVAEYLEQECRWTGGELRSRRTGRRVRAVIPVHVLGHPVDLDPVLDLARRYGLAVIEDAAESLGARYRGRHVGALGDAACLSFNGNKIITSGGGGMFLTDRQDWAARARYLTTQAKDDPFEYVHGAVGYNYRLTNLQAAVGCAQLERLDDYVERKRGIWKRYVAVLGQTPGLRVMQEADWAFSTCWLSTVLVDPDHYGESSRPLMRRLESVGIQSRPLWHPLHLNPPFRALGRWDCPHAEALCGAAVSLPSSCGLSGTDQDRVIRALLRQGVPGASETATGQPAVTS